MKKDSLKILIEPKDIHDFVMNLWAEGPVKESHKNGGYIHDLIDRFARLPRFFGTASNNEIEWTHFSPWWGGILLCEYDNPHIRDLRYLHEIYHAATLPNIANLNRSTLEAKNFHNEWKASTFSEMSIYLELPELRALSFEHEIFADRFIFPDGDFTKTDTEIFRRWKEEPDLVFQELMYARASVVSSEEHEIDPNDPQIIWLRRYPEQREHWLNIWEDRYQQVENSMILLRENSFKMGRSAAMKRHMDWLFSDEITNGTDIPFIEEAKAFRQPYDKLIKEYDAAMEHKGQKSVKPVNDMTTKASEAHLVREFKPN